MPSSHGPTLRELTVQALSSVEHGYDLLAPKFDHTSFRTPANILTATTAALASFGPFDDGLDVCCGTGAGLSVLDAVCRSRVTGVDFSTGMLDEARQANPGAGLVRADALALPFRAGFDLAVSFGALGHFLPAERPALFAGIHRALRPGGVFAMPLGGPPPVTSRWFWMTLGFDAVMRVRNAVWRPKFVMYYRTTPIPAVLTDLRAVGFHTETVPLPLPGLSYELVVARRAAG